MALSLGRLYHCIMVFSSALVHFSGGKFLFHIASTF
jgi:hypothetical protein